jgi:hypothetical protein
MAVLINIPFGGGDVIRAALKRKLPSWPPTLVWRIRYPLMSLYLPPGCSVSLLASGTPRRWLAAGEKIELKNAPTYFGPVSYTMTGSKSGVEATVQLPSCNRLQTAWLVVRLPEGERIGKVEIDGKPWRDFDATAERVRLPLIGHSVRVSAYF